MRGEDIVGVAMAASFVIADGLKSDIVLSLADFFTMIGSNLTAIADVRAREDAKKDEDKSN